MMRVLLAKWMIFAIVGLGLLLMSLLFGKVGRPDYSCGAGSTRMRLLLVKGMMFAIIGFGFLPLCFFLGQEGYSSFGAGSSDMVFVTQGGEVTGPAYLIRGQFGRVAIVQEWSILMIVVGLLMCAIAIIARRFRSVDIGTTKSSLVILRNILGKGVGAILAGIFIAILVFMPLKSLPDSAFAVVFLLLCGVTVAVIIRKEQNVSTLLAR